MTNPWDGPRHRSWASNTVLTFILLLVLIVATVVSDALGEPPSYLVGLLGTAAGAFFAALGSDKSKRDTEVRVTAVDAQQTAHRAEDKVDDVKRQVDATDSRADDAEQRESGWSRHRDHGPGEET